MSDASKPKKRKTKAKNKRKTEVMLEVRFRNHLTGDDSVIQEAMNARVNTLHTAFLNKDLMYVDLSTVTFSMPDGMSTEQALNLIHSSFKEKEEIHSVRVQTMTPVSR
jgi:muramoyltetrapeptide carboxypeptidase LdcA involved in peptidoglycan recycling